MSKYKHLSILEKVADVIIQVAGKYIIKNIMLEL